MVMALWPCLSSRGITPCLVLLCGCAFSLVPCGRSHIWLVAVLDGLFDCQGSLYTAATSVTVLSWSFDIAYQNKILLLGPGPVINFWLFFNYSWSQLWTSLLHIILLTHIYLKVKEIRIISNSSSVFCSVSLYSGLILLPVLLCCILLLVLFSFSVTGLIFVVFALFWFENLVLNLYRSIFYEFLV